MVNTFRQKALNFDWKKLRNASWVSCVKRVGKTSQNATKFIGIGNLKNIFAQIGIEFKEKYIYTYIKENRSKMIGILFIRFKISIHITQPHLIQPLEY